MGRGLQRIQQDPAMANASALNPNSATLASPVSWREPDPIQPGSTANPRRKRPEPTQPRRISQIPNATSASPTTNPRED